MVPVEHKTLKYSYIYNIFKIYQERKDLYILEYLKTYQGRQDLYIWNNKIYKTINKSDTTYKNQNGYLGKKTGFGYVSIEDFKHSN